MLVKVIRFLNIKLPGEKYFYLVGVGLLAVIQACEYSNTNSDKNHGRSNISIGLLVDVDETPNRISEQVMENNTEVGITAFANDPDNKVTYQLLDSANGRFAINESTGTVYLADYLLLNTNLFPVHSIRIQASSSDGSFQTKTFEIQVSRESVATYEELQDGVQHTKIAKDAVVQSNQQSRLIDNKSKNIERTLSVESQKISSSDEQYEKKQNNKKGLIFQRSNTHNLALVSQYKVLLDWNNGNNQELYGWDWLDDVAYGNPGWLLSKGGPLGKGQQFSWGQGVRSFNKGDYGKQNTALIDTQDFAPSTDSGGSLQVKETSNSKDHRSTWWVWYDGMPLSERGVTDSKTDRMDFYLKVEGMGRLKDDGRKESIKNNFHIGTYLCWNSNKPSYGRGGGCPYEGPGNQHYYHYLAVNSDAWIHVLLDQRPQHKRGNKTKISNNPTWNTNKKNYFAQLSQFYMEIRAKQKKKTNFRVDELIFHSSKDSVEPMQNEESISSLWVGYWPKKDVWEIGFHDNSQRKYNDQYNSTFEIRWSTKPITNDNFNDATPITPMFYGGLQYVGNQGANLIRRPNGWQSNVWTRFKLPDDIENSYPKVFFAVKDVSVKGRHIGTKWPYNKGDGQDAPSDNVKIIDYHLNINISGK